MGKGGGTAARGERARAAASASTSVKESAQVSITADSTNFMNPKEREQAIEASRKIIGPNATNRDIADILGVPGDAKIRIAGVGDKRFHVFVEHPDFKAERSIFRDSKGNLVISNIELRVFNQGKGIGTKIFATQVKNAIRLGAKRIETIAAQGGPYVGYKVWYKLGYDGPLSSDMKALMRAADKDGTLPAQIRGAKRISDVVATKAGRDWWDQNGEGWVGTFDLRRGSYSRRQLANYLKEIRKR